MKINWNKAWDIAAWISFAYLLLYLTLKVAGVLHSPPPADYAAVLGLGILFGRHFQKVDHIHKDVELLKKKMGRVERHMPDVFAGIE